MDKKIVAREYVSTTSSVLDRDGYWKAINKIVDRVLYEGETEYVEEMVEAMSVDTNSQQAVQTAMSSTLNYLIQSVYQNGFNGLVEYREYERETQKLKESVKELGKNEDKPQPSETQVL